MRVSVVRGGGLAGITTRTELASAALPDDEARTLAGLVDRAGLREGARGVLRDASRAGPSGADQLLYAVQVIDDQREVLAHFHDGDVPDEVLVLVEWVDSRTERTHRTEP